jgi:hypothetical protein
MSHVVLVISHNSQPSITMTPTPLSVKPRTAQVAEYERVVSNYQGKALTFNLLGCIIETNGSDDDIEAGHVADISI